MSIAMYLAVALEILMCLVLLEVSVVHNDINVVSTFESSFFSWHQTASSQYRGVASSACED